MKKNYLFALSFLLLGLGFIGILLNKDRHALHDRLGFDYYSIDCAETQDGRLLVFEADAAAIIHLMDPAAMFPYKQPQMRRVFAAFQAMLDRRVALSAQTREPADVSAA